jgi:hypothetical protein
MQRESGVVIVAVLWICALVMWFALQIGSNTRLQSEEQVLSMRKSQALHLAIGGGYEAIAHMGTPRSTGLGTLNSGRSLRGGFGNNPEEWAPDGRPHLIQYQAGEVIVVVSDENQKVNVNKANHDQLKEAVQKAGAEEELADKLADMIGDFVDKDDMPRLHGAEKDQYKRLGLPYGPLNGPLLTLDQLLRIPGITQQAFYGIGQPAPQEVEEDEATALLHSRFPPEYSLFQTFTVYGNNTKLPDKKNDELLGKVVSWQNGGVYRILACGRAYSGPPAVVLWLTVRNAPQSERGYEVLFRKIL